MALTKFNYNSFDVTPAASQALAFNSDADGLTTAASGSMVLIKTLTADGSGTNLAFVDGASDVVLDNTYPTYLIKFINIHPQTNAVIFSFQVSTDTGSSYGVAVTGTYFNAYHNEAGTGQSLSYEANSDPAQATGEVELVRQDKLSADNDHCGNGEMWLFNPSSTTFVKHYLARTQVNHEAEYSLDSYLGGYINSTSAVDAIRFSVSSGNIDAGTIKLYGIKDS